MVLCCPVNGWCSCCSTGASVQDAKQKKAIAGARRRAACPCLSPLSGFLPWPVAASGLSGLCARNSVRRRQCLSLHMYDGSEFWARPWANSTTSRSDQRGAIGRRTCDLVLRSATWQEPTLPRSISCAEPAEFLRQRNAGSAQTARVEPLWRLGRHTSSMYTKSNPIYSSELRRHEHQVSDVHLHQ